MRRIQVSTEIVRNSLGVVTECRRRSPISDRCPDGIALHAIQLEELRACHALCMGHPTQIRWRPQMKVP